MKEREALKLALEALEDYGHAWPRHVVQYTNAITAIKEALAQPEQEPAAWGNLANWCLDSDRVLITDKDEAAKYHRDVYDLTPLYTTPPQRTWVGLTDEQIKVMWRCSKIYGTNEEKALALARAIEAAHGIKE